MDNNQFIPRDKFEFNYLISNTKLRRLGYLKILLSMFKQSEDYPVASFNQKFEITAVRYEQDLMNYKNQKGIIKKTKNGISASPYVDLALSLNLIVKNSFYYQLGKCGKVFNILKARIDEKMGNPFELSLFDTIFFLELLLRKDFWFLSIILEQTYKNHSIKYTILKKEFKHILLESINDVKHHYYQLDADNTFNFDIETKITQWDNNNSYFEHILMPRINWLYDMNFIELTQDLSFNLSPSGISLFHNLQLWNERARHKIISAEEFVQCDFLKIINEVFGLRKKRFIFAEIYDLLNMYLEECFLMFKTMAPNRTTFSMFALFAKEMLFFKHSIVIDEIDIKMIYESEFNSKYIFKYQEQYQDGYFQKIK